MTPQTKTPLHVSFNQDHTSFAVANRSGFTIFSCEPAFRELFRRDSDKNETITAVEMLFNSNIFAIVTKDLDEINRVILWDDSRSLCTNKLTFRTEVKSVNLRKDRVVVVFLQMVKVYKLEGLKLIADIETFANPKGLCAVSTQDNDAPMVLVCPGLRKGQVRVVDYGLDLPMSFNTVHDSELGCLALSRNGKCLATASSKGTLIRVWDPAKRSLHQEVRRGVDRAEIHCLTFNPTCEWLAASSDKGTIHVFKLNPNVLPPPTNNNPSSSLSLVKGVVVPKYLSSEKSLAQFRLPQGLRHTVAFGHEKNTVIILGADGSFYRCRFNPVHGGEMMQLARHHFLKPHRTSNYS